METDLDFILEIEKLSFPSPWSRQTFAGELQRQWAALWVLEPPIRYEKGAPIASFLNFWRVLDEVHIMNIATHPGYRRKGFARVLLERLFSEVAIRGGGEASLEVRPGNRAALRLYKSLGFTEIGIRLQYYADTGEDAIVMAASINAASPGR